MTTALLEPTVATREDDRVDGMPSVGEVAGVSAPLLAPGERLLVVVTHPDQVSDGFRTLISRAARSGVDVTVTCATRGDNHDPERQGEISGTALAFLQESELRSSARSLGARRTIVLGYRRSGASGSYWPDAICGADPAHLVDDLMAVSQRVRPDVVVTPDGRDGDPDDVRLRDAVWVAVRRTGDATRLYHAPAPTTPWTRDTNELTRVA
jgi:LmbE family N-acetylglucosaminyl deacetylase